MDINTTNGPITGFQTTDGGYKYRRVQAIKVGTSNQTGLLEVESKYSTDGKGIGRLLVKVDMPYFTANTAACCCDDSGATTPTYSQAGKISFHTVLTLPKAAIGDVKSPNAVLAANQIATVMGLCLAMANISPGLPKPDASGGLAFILEDDKLTLNTESDIAGILDPKRSVIRSIMGVTPLPPEGFAATELYRALHKAP